ncbi:unnamed protein product [Colias eurytheme]|nr:unnamed protein product [Colias eurytheme]
MDSLKETMAQMTENFNTRMEEFQKELQNNTSPATTNISTDFELFRKFVLSSLKNIQAEIELLYKLHDLQETRSRRKMLLIHGVDEDKKEDTHALVLKTLSDKLPAIKISSDSISRVHRMGRAEVNGSNSKPRPILVKFSDVQIKDSIWFKKSNLKNSGITLSEFLTKSRHETFIAARKRFGINKCWTRDGNIFIIGQSGDKFRVTSLNELDLIPCTTSGATQVIPNEQSINDPKTSKCVVASRSRRLVKQTK